MEPMSWEAVGVVAMVVVAVVVGLVVFGVESGNRESAEHKRWRAGLQIDQATIRVCVVATEDDSADSVAYFLAECLRLAASPARLRFAVVTDGATSGSRGGQNGFAQAYCAAAGPVAASRLATQLRVAEVVHDESRGWMEAWEKWHAQLEGGESCVLVVDPRAHVLREEWDVHVARLVLEDLPFHGIFTAAGNGGSEFPALAFGHVDHNSFPRVFGRGPFATRAENWATSAAADVAAEASAASVAAPPKGNLTPAVALDKRLLAFAGHNSAAAARAVKGLACSAAEADVALSARLFGAAGFSLWTRSATDWSSAPPPTSAAVYQAAGGGGGGGDYNNGCSEDAGACLQPFGGTHGEWQRARVLGRDYEEYAGLRSTQDKMLPEANAPLYALTARARLGVTTQRGPAGLQEIRHKYGSVARFEDEQRRVVRDLRTQGRARGDDESLRLVGGSAE